MNYLNPTQDERHQVIEAAVPLFKARFYSPGLHGVDLDTEVQRRMPELMATDDFAGEMKALFATTKAYPINVFYEPERGCRWRGC